MAGIVTTVNVVVADLPAVKSALNALAFEAWSGTQRCVFCPRGRCERCTTTLATLTALGFDEQMREWADG